jgi:hypothetical protein
MLNIIKISIFSFFCFCFICISESITNAETSNSGKTRSVILIDAYFEGTSAELQKEYSKGFLKGLEKINNMSSINRIDTINGLMQQFVTPSKQVQNEKIGEIDKLIKEGEKLLLDVNPISAINALNTALSEIREIGEMIYIDSTLREYNLSVQMLLASAYLENKNPEKAAEIMENVIRIYGDEIKVTEDNYHPSFVKEFNKILKELEKKKKAGLKIDTSPSGCDISVDGRKFQGSTPLEINNLYEGNHVLRFKCDNLESQLYKISLESGETVGKKYDVLNDRIFSINRDLLGVNFINADEFINKGPAFVSLIKNYIKAETVFLAGIIEKNGTKKITGMLIDLNDNRIIASKKADVPADTDPYEISINFTRDFFFMKKITTIGWYESWPGLALVGAGALSWGFGSYFISSYFEHKNNAENPNWPSDPQLTETDKYEKRLDERDKGNTARTWAWILCSAGTAAIAGGVTMFILHGNIEKVEETGISFEQSVKQEYVVVPFVLPEGGGAAAIVKF